MMESRIIGKAEPASTRQDSEFRLFVYTEPTTNVEIYGIKDCPVEEALEAAEMLSRHDQLLWSLALVTGAPRRKLTWISGTDYNEPPRTPRDWQLRGQMQSRYLAAQSLRGEAPLLPSDLKLIRMFPEWGVDLPLWGQLPDPHPYEPGGLPIPAELEEDLVAWSREWNNRQEDSEVPDVWKDRGWMLFRQLQNSLTGFAEVHPSFDDREWTGRPPNSSM